MKNDRSLTPNKAFACGIAAILLLGLLDYATGWEFGFFVFYFFPIGFVAWRTDRRHSHAASVISTAVWFLADRYSGHPYSHAGYAFWNAGIRLLCFVFIGHAISRIRGLLEEERKISNALQSALDEVKTLTGLLPICASCKRIRNDEGYWQQIENYITMHSEVHFRRSVCPECGEAAGGGQGTTRRKRTEERYGPYALTSLRWHSAEMIRSP